MATSVTNSLGFADSTTLQLVRVLTQLADAKNKNLSTEAALLDVSNAFDKVWHEGLLYKLTLTSLPSIVVFFLQSYLSDRIFRISSDGACSRACPVAAGVPQGSVPCPVLYLVYTNDLPLYTGVTLSLFADDAVFHYSTLSPGFASVVLQHQLAILTGWLRRCRVAINTKSEAICFTRKSTSGLHPLSLEEKPITWKKSVKYVGVSLDQRLKFNDHATNTLAKVRRVKAKLYPML